MQNKLPYDTSAEAGIIATLLQHPDFILHSDYLSASHFYHKDNGAFYWAIQELYKSGVTKIDSFNLLTQINSHNGIKNLISRYNIESIDDYIEKSKNIARHTVEEYKKLVEIVVALAFKRELHKKLMEIDDVCLDENNNDIAKLSNFAYNSLDEVITQFITAETIVLFGDIVDELWKEIVERRNPNGMYGIPSKYSSINKYFTYEPGELVLFQARMKRGKSAFMMNEAIHKLQNGIPVAYFDTEMQSRLFFERMLAYLTKIPVQKIKSGNYTTSEEQQIEEAKKWLKKQKFVHIYNPEWTNDKILITAKILKHKINLGFLVFDYIKSNTKSSSEQYNELGAKADFLKNNVAGALNIPVLAGAQLNRQGQTADSDKLERYCSVSVIWREKTKDEILTDGENCGNYALNVKLNRLGEQMQEDDYIDFRFDGSIMTIEEAEQHSKELPFN
jgi:replicative DNA helicase